VLLRRRAGFSDASRAFHACTRLLCREAGWPEDPELVWFPVAVDCDRRRRPRTVRWTDAELLASSAPKAARTYALDVLGAVMGLTPRKEAGFRVRLESGAEVTLVREAGGFWYADEAEP
jgi:hypothetical protein